MEAFYCHFKDANGIREDHLGIAIDAYPVGVPDPESATGQRLELKVAVLWFAAEGEPTMEPAPTLVDSKNLQALGLVNGEAEAETEAEAEVEAEVTED